MIVVDTNVIAYLYLPGDRTAAAEALCREDSEWSAPLLWRSELRNVLATQIRVGRIELDGAQSIQTEAVASRARICRGLSSSVAPGCRIRLFGLRL